MNHKSDLSCKIYFFFFLFLLSCDTLESQLERVSLSSQRPSDNNLFQAGVCDQECIQDCKVIFFDRNDIEKCSGLTANEVQTIGQVDRQMRRGNWESISILHLAVMLKVSHAKWIQYGRTSAESAGKMLKWISKEEEVTSLLDEDGEVLKSGFEGLSPYNNVRGVKDGLTRRIDGNRTFLENSAWENNDGAFPKTHQVIVEVCNSQPRCIEDIYCRHASDLVIETVVEQELDALFRSSDQFSRGQCSSPLYPQ